MKLKCLLAMLLLTFLSCSNTPAVEDKIDSLPHSEPGKTLIVYFSWSGHTQTVANIIHELIGCDMVEIEPKNPILMNIMKWLTVSKMKETIIFFQLCVQK